MEPAKSYEQKKEFHLFLPFRQSKYFTAIYFGQLISYLGSSITSVILPIIVMNLTNSTLAMGSVMSLYSLAFVLILPFSGIIVDRLNRIHVMLVTDLLRFTLIGFIVSLLVTDYFALTYLYITMFFMGLLDGLFHPAYASARAKIFTPEIRTAANSVTQISNQAVTLLGPTIGGIIITTFSASIGLGIDALTYLLSFFFILNLRSMPLLNSSGISSKKTTFLSDFMEGFLVLKGIPWLWITILAFSLINICTGGIIRVLLPWLINNHHHLEPYVYGLIISASGIGAMISGVIFGLRKQWRHRGWIAYGGVGLSGISLLFFPFVNSTPLLMVLMMIEGAGIMMFALIWETSMQELVPDEKFGRVASLDMLGSFALLPVGYLLTGWGANIISSQSMILLLCSIILLIVMLALLHKGIRSFD